MTPEQAEKYFVKYMTKWGENYQYYYEAFKTIKEYQGV